MRHNYRLTAAAQLERDDFDGVYGDSACSCHTNPPCNYCLHPGNPKNQEEDSNWEPTTSLILIYDFETTGLPEWSLPSEDPIQPHAVQIGAILIDEDTREVKATLDVIVKPDGWSWDETNVAFQTHGITMERALAEGIPEKEAYQKLIDLWNQAKLRVAHNESFDSRLARIGLKRYFTEELAEQFKNAKHACTGIMAKPIMQMLPKNKYGFKMPKLVEAYKHFTGRDLENAHNAMADCMACKDIYFAIKDAKVAA